MVLKLHSSNPGGLEVPHGQHNVSVLPCVLSCNKNNGTLFPLIDLEFTKYLSIPSLADEKLLGKFKYIKRKRNGAII